MRRGLRCLALAAALASVAAPAASKAPTAGAPASAAARDELAHWVLIGRARPEDAAPALEALAARLAGDPLGAIEARVALGNVQVALADVAGLGSVIAQLRQVGDAPGRKSGTAALGPLARACADALQSQQIRLQGPVGRAERLLADTIERLPEHTPDSLRLRFLAWHADLLERAAQFEGATRRHQEAIVLADSIGAPDWQQAELRAALAKTLYLAGQIDRARELSRAALVLAQRSGDDRALSFVYKTEGVVQSADSLNENSLVAEQAMRTALDYAVRAGARRDEVRATANLADMALRRGDYTQALAYSERAQPLAHALRDRNSESVALANAGFARIMLGQQGTGMTLAKASMALDEQAGETSEVASTQGELGHYLEKAGQLGEAYAAYSAYRRMSEQVSRSELQRKLGELQEAFDHDRRLRELELLEREGRFQQAQLMSRRLKQWLWATGVLVGATILGLGALLLLRVRAGNQQLAQTNLRLAELSERDPLTGLTNRRGCQSAMQAAWPAAGTLALMDLDHFKRINDSHGHAGGDAVLVEIARRLRASLRPDDVVVRWGGEEFLIWLPGVPGAEADVLVARLLELIAGEAVAFDAARIAVTASVGFASLPVEPGGVTPDWQHAVALVDAAMYLAKAHGRNRAYGIRRVIAGDADGLAAQARDLESSWRDGQVDLAVVGGPLEEPA